MGLPLLYPGHKGISVLLKTCSLRPSSPVMDASSSYHIRLHLYATFPLRLPDLIYSVMYRMTRWFDLPSPALDQSAPYDRLAQSGTRSTRIHSQGDKDKGIKVKDSSFIETQ
jgi:hypothetical protein